VTDAQLAWTQSGRGMLRENVRGNVLGKLSRKMAGEDVSSTFRLQVSAVHAAVITSVTPLLTPRQTDRQLLTG